MEGGFFTLVLTFFKLFFYSRIVDSVFYCMFTPSQRCGTKQTPKWKEQSKLKTDITKWQSRAKPLQSTKVETWTPDGGFGTSTTNALDAAKANSTAKCFWITRTQRCCPQMLDITATKKPQQPNAPHWNKCGVFGCKQTPRLWKSNTPHLKT